jgi:hypothetical protein
LYIFRELLPRLFIAWRRIKTKISASSIESRTLESTMPFAITEKE